MQRKKAHHDYSAGPDGGVFQTRQWAEVLREAYGIRPFFLKSGGATFSFSLLKSRIFGNRLISVPFADYGGLQGRGADAEKLVEEALRIAGKEDIDFMEVRTQSPELSRMLEKLGFERREDYVTFILDLARSEDEIFRGMEKRVRNDINKSRKSGISFREGNTAADIETFHGVYLDTMKRIGSPPQSLKFFTRLWETFGGKGMRIRMAELEGRAVACCLFFISGKTVNYSYGCSVNEHKSLRASDGLLWDSIMAFKEEGFSIFDFGRTRPNSGVYFHKRGWGGREVPMPYYYRFYKKRIENRQEIKYQRYSEIWRIFMPGTLAKMLGPWIIKQIG